MNREKMLALADYIENGKTRFSMLNFDSCIAAQLVYMDDKDKPHPYRIMLCTDRFEYARQALQLGHEEAFELFIIRDHMMEVSRAQAANVLRRLAKMEEVEVNPQSIVRIWMEEVPYVEAIA